MKPRDAFYCSAYPCKSWSRVKRLFICGDHWRQLTKAERRVWCRVAKRARAYGWRDMPPDLSARIERIWRAILDRSTRAN